ncbi:hypothetical protein ACWDWO_05565 [Actinopolymorpha singaporensis]|uniref:Uncharacterized protein n=1 Tax=Actinopolymorpha singaporensis TaxID=117157 RepID=A0A1H1XPM1_9ACTN|nr:hypothetical protein [Actinopolymorpha singaporensis]SDT10736.1 hypothetical protein SAMN04489717_5058 [Actinopolymorpha singaporensis]
MPARFNAPPNWPVPSGWTPPPHWRPDPAWGPPPYGWQVWVEESPPRSACRRRQVLVAFGVVVGLGSMVGYVHAFSAPEPEPATTFTTNTEDARNPAAEPPAPASREGVRPTGRGTEVDVSRRDPPPYTVSPPDVDTPPSTRAPRPPAPQGRRSGQPDAPNVSPGVTPPPDAADGRRKPSSGKLPPNTPGPRTRPGPEANEHPHQLGDGRGPGDRQGDRNRRPPGGHDHSDHSRPRPRFEQPVEVLQRTRPASPTTPAPTTPAPTTPPLPGTAAGSRGLDHAS